MPHPHVAPSNEAVTETFDEHMHRILQLSSSWLGQLEPLVEQLSRQTEMVSHQIGGVQPLLREFTDGLLARGKTAPAKAAVNPPKAAKKPAARRKPAPRKTARRTPRKTAS